MTDALDDRMIQHAANALRRKGYEQDAEELLRVWGLPTIQDKRRGAVDTIARITAGFIVWLIGTIAVAQSAFSMTADKGYTFAAFIACFALGAGAALSFAARRGAFD